MEVWLQLTEKKNKRWKGEYNTNIQQLDEFFFKWVEK